jgi:parallel beta-helix repeat protein
VLVDAGSGNEIVENLVSRNSSFGVLLNASSGNIGRGNVVTRSTTGLRLERGANDNSIRENRLSENGESGVPGINGGIVVTDSSGNSLAQNAIDETTGFTGLGLHRADRNRVIANQVRGGTNWGTGMFLADSGSNLVAGNVVRAVPQGISIAVESHRNVLKKNRVVGGDRAGFFFQRAHENTVVGNIVSDHERGIHLTIEVAENTFRGNTLLRNQVAGIHLDGPYGFEISDGNRFIANRSSENAGDGLWSELDPGGGETYTGTLIRRNVFELNGDDGLDLDGPSNTAAQNRANRNGDLGIEAHPGVTDGGGNRAEGNGNPAQCIGVRCR